MLTKPRRHGCSDLHQSFDYKEYRKRIENNRQGTVAEIKQDGQAHKHPEDARYGQQPPNRFEDRRSEQKKNETNHGTFRFVLAIQFVFPK